MEGWKSPPPHSLATATDTSSSARAVLNTARSSTAAASCARADSSLACHGATVQRPPASATLLHAARCITCCSLTSEVSRRSIAVFSWVTASFLCSRLETADLRSWPALRSLPSNPARVSSQLQQGFSIGIAAVSRGGTFVELDPQRPFHLLVPLLGLPAATRQNWPRRHWPGALCRRVVCTCCVDCDGPFTLRRRSSAELAELSACAR